MRFAFTDDQRLFAEGLRDLLAKECPPALVRDVWENGTGHSPELWAHLSGMGVLSMLAPEADGGMGGSFVDAILLFQELGRAAVPGPVLEHMAVAVPALASTPFGASLIAGESIATLWVDDSPYVAHGGVADLIVRRDCVLRSFKSTDAHGMDGGRRLFTVTGGERTDTDVSVAGLDPFDAMALAVAAYLIGLSERMIEIAAEYARVREQFGKPIGSFQAVKHLMSDALLKVEFAKAPTYRAAFSASTGATTIARDISMAKALAGEAAYRSSRSTMQVHGGIGYTWEADLQLFMKKAWALMRSYGDANFHRRRVSGVVLA
ncbi:MAG: acyl-CoA dehydrogenase family protein [Actinobacteria bacterium]|nr:acyl-CoA dehydrogenase family protein [Actinomycetota bacterium]